MILLGIRFYEVIMYASFRTITCFPLRTINKVSMVLPFCPVFASDMVQRLYTPYFFSEGQNSLTDEPTEVKPGLD